jgi:hypothetical protein
MLRDALDEQHEESVAASERLARVTAETFEWPQGDLVLLIKAIHRSTSSVRSYSNWCVAPLQTPEERELEAWYLRLGDRYIEANEKAQRRMESTHNLAWGACNAKVGVFRLTLAAMPRRRTSGFWAVHSSIRAWLLSKLQFAATDMLLQVFLKALTGGPQRAGPTRS